MFFVICCVCESVCIALQSRIASHAAQMYIAIVLRGWTIVMLRSRIFLSLWKLYAPEQKFRAENGGLSRGTYMYLICIHMEVPPPPPQCLTSSLELWLFRWWGEAIFRPTITLSWRFMAYQPNTESKAYWYEEHSLSEVNTTPLLSSAASNTFSERSGHSDNHVHLPRIKQS